MESSLPDLRVRVQCDESIKSTRPLANEISDSGCLWLAECRGTRIDLIARVMAGSYLAPMKIEVAILKNAAIVGTTGFLLTL